MSGRRNRSHSRSGAAGERGGGGARRSDPASPPLRAPSLRRSQRKSGSEPDIPPQPSTPAPWKTFSLKKIGPPAVKRGPEAPAKRSEPRTPEAPSPRIQKSIPGKRSAPQTPAERSAPQNLTKRSESRIPAKRSAPQTPAERNAPQTPAERNAPQNLAKRSESRIPAKRSAPQTPAERSAPQTPAERNAPQNLAKRSESHIPAKRSAPQTPTEKSAPQTPAEKSAPGASTDKGAPSSRAKRSSPRIPAERSEPRTPEAAPAVARRAISEKKLVARTQESQSPSSRGSRSAAKKKAFPSAEVTLSEKENSPPLQENAPLRKGGSSLAVGPAPEVTPTVLGPLTPNAVATPPLMDARDLEMSQKVRRSYSRLNELGLGSGSTSTPNYQRRSFFGFERLLSGEELENVSPVMKESKHPAAAPSTEAWGPDSILPGIPMTKEKRRKRKVPEILKSELDEWAAAMNAQFEAAEKFDLLVE